MPMLKRSVAGKPGKDAAPATVVAAVASVKVDLPTEPSARSNDLNDYHILIHGEKKIGKTTIAAVEPGTFSLTFDPERKGLEIMQRHMPDWKTFAAYLAELEKVARGRKFPYKRIVIDGADVWYRKCQSWAENKLKVDHISEEKWGRGWDLLKETFTDAVVRIMGLPCGVWFITHSAWREVETRDANVKIEKLVPLMKQGGEEILNGRVDAWFAYDYAGGERVMYIRGNERIGAGCAIKGHFETPGGAQVKEIPMGDSEEEAYENLLKAFHNKQTFVTLKQRDKRASGGKGG